MTTSFKSNKTTGRIRSMTSNWSGTGTAVDSSGTSKNSEKTSEIEMSIFSAKYESRPIDDLDAISHVKFPVRPPALASLGDGLFVQRHAEESKRKSERYKCRKEQIALGKASEDRNVRAAAARFEKNNRAIEKANLASHVYSPNKPAPVGWRVASSDELKKFQLSTDDLRIRGSDYAAAVYLPDESVFGGDMNPTVAFKGTSSLEDWGNNGSQGLNLHSDYYEKSVQTGTKLRSSGANFELTGHSLGGGQASAASRASGLPATTFNAAGLHSETVTRYGGTVHQPRTENIQAYRVAGEILAVAQQSGHAGTILGVAGANPLMLATSAAMPNAVGVPHVLAAKSIDPVSRHFMGDVINGIEEQKSRDQQIIANSTGKKCPA